MSSDTVGVGVDDLVTGEAVALELPAAGIALHALSGFLDVTITVLVLVAGGHSSDGDGYQTTAEVYSPPLAYPPTPTTTSGLNSLRTFRDIRRLLNNFSSTLKLLNVRLRFSPLTGNPIIL